MRVRIMHPASLSWTWTPNYGWSRFPTNTISNKFPYHVINYDIFDKLLPKCGINVYLKDDFKVIDQWTGISLYRVIWMKFASMNIINYGNSVQILTYIHSNVISDDRVLSMPSLLPFYHLALFYSILFKYCNNDLNTLKCILYLNSDLKNQYRRLIEEDEINEDNVFDLLFLSYESYEKIHKHVLLEYYY